MGLIQKTRAGLKGFSFAFNNLSKIEQVGSQTWYGFGSGLSSEYWGGDVNTWLKDYLEVPEVQASINWKARAFSNMKLDVVNAETLAPAPGTNKAAQLIRRPNYFQSQKEFIRQTRLFYYIFGNEIIYGNRPFGFSVKTVNGLFSLPYNLLSIKADIQKHFFFQNELPKVEMKMRFGGYEIPIPYTDCMHLNDNNVQLTAKDFLVGTSRLGALQAPIKNLRAAYEARNVMIENRGALGILTNAGADAGGSIPLDPDDKDQLQADFKKYGLTKKQHQFILTSLSLKWQQIAIDTDKLKLFEEATEDQRKIIDGFGLRTELFARERGATYQNQIQAERAVYQDTIIPEAEEWTTALTEYLGLSGTAYKVHGTFDHLAVFQDNKKEYATGLRLLAMALSEAYSQGIISFEQYQEQLAKYGIDGDFPKTPKQLTEGT